MVLLPAVFYGVYAAYVIQRAKFYQYYYEDNTQESDYHNQKATKFLQAIGIFSAVGNVFSCAILILVVRLINKMAVNVRFGGKKISNQSKVNQIVTASHLTLIFACTILSIFYLNVPSTNGSGGSFGNDSSVINVRLRNAWTFMGGIADLSITCQLYVILEERESE